MTKKVTAEGRKYRRPLFRRHLPGHFKSLPVTHVTPCFGEVIAADGRRSLEQGMAALRELLAGAGVSTGPLLLADAARSEIALTSGNDGVT